MLLSLKTVHIILVFREINHHLNSSRDLDFIYFSLYISHNIFPLCFIIFYYHYFLFYLSIHFLFIIIFFIKIFFDFHIFLLPVCFQILYQTSWKEIGQNLRKKILFLITLIKIGLKFFNSELCEPIHGFLFGLYE